MKYAIAFLTPFLFAACAGTQSTQPEAQSNDASGAAVQA